MSNFPNPNQAPQYNTAAYAAADARANFIAKTYLHLAGAIMAFVLLEVIIFNIPGTEGMVQTMMGGRWSWAIVLGLFMLVSWIANSWALSTTSLGIQYMGLALYVVAEAIIFTPLLYIASWQDPMIIPAAALTTFGLFTVLTAVVFITRKDFSFLRSVLIFGGFAALGLIFCAIGFGLELGPIFTYAMIAFACAYILYDTSNILHHYRLDQPVAAALALFASVALLFWYIIRLFLSRR
ncbi:MAG: Bax inhibitor-1 family protein [Planctomycetia bacterium]|jgi:FtsH-binding integral membrane protein